MEGIGEDHIPGNLNLDIIDEGIYVSDKDAFEMLSTSVEPEEIDEKFAEVMEALPDVEEAVNGSKIATAPKSLDRFNFSTL